MRLSEFGTNSPANLEVWHREIPPVSQWPLEDQNDPVLIRKNVFWGAAIAPNWLHKEISDSLFGPAESLEQVVQGGQFLGAEGLRYAMDALRRKGPALGGGFMSWDYNEPWPNGAGSYMIDYDGRPLMNYDFVRQALAPVSLSLEYDSILYDPAAGMKAELWIASDAPRPAEGLKWQWLARDRRGQVFAKGAGAASVAPQEAMRLATLELKPPAKTAFGPLFVELQLRDAGGKLLAERIHVFGINRAQDPLGGLRPNAFQDTDDDAERAARSERPGSPADQHGASPEERMLLRRPVTRTTLTVTAKPGRVEGDVEILEIVLKNTGRMTALFCTPHPLLEYRTDFFVDNNNCFIPPGESRTIAIRAPRNAAGGLSLAQTGWRLSAWNADDQVIEPGDRVLLAVGRRDAMCREFLGYDDPSKATGRSEVTLTGRRPDASALPYCMTRRLGACFRFMATAEEASRAARLRLHAADQSADVAATVEIQVNGRPFTAALPKGLEIQATDPAHLAFPATAEIALPQGVLKAGKNMLEVRVSNDGWFTWDALDLVGGHR